MTQKDQSSRYLRSAVLQGAMGVGTGAALAYGGALFYKIVSLKWSLSSDESRSVVDQKLASLGEQKTMRKCDRATSVASAGVPERDQKYLNCINEEVTILGHGPVIVAAFWLATFSIKSLGRSAAYARLALLSKKLDRFFRMGAVHVPEAERIVARPASSFNIVDGVGPHASIILEPEAEVYAETGAFMAKNSGISMKVRHPDKKNLKDIGGQLLSGEGITQLHFQNQSEEPQELLLNPRHGQLLSIDMHGDEAIYCRNGAFFAAANPVQIGLRRIRDISFTMFSGHGATMQVIAPKSDQGGALLLNATGRVSERVLKEGEVMEVQKGSLLAFNHHVSLGLVESGSLLTRIGSGENNFLMAVKGPGRIWLEGTSSDDSQLTSRSFIGRMIPG